MKDIGMDYEAIHACPNDHIIYYKEHEFAAQCPICHTSRYRTDRLTKKVPQKVLRYNPLFHGCDNYSGVVAWLNLWIIMHAIEVKMTLFESLWMVWHLCT